MIRHIAAQYAAYRTILTHMRPMGYTIKEMAAACRVREHVVERLLLKLGLTRTLRPWKITKAQLQQDYNTMSPLQVAVKYDRQLCHVYIKMQQLGIPVKRNVSFEKPKKQFAADWMLLTWKELMVKYGVAIDSWRRRLGLPCRTTGHRSGILAREAFK